ncbi:M3 family oligoendopeptidase [Patescibacteria group bacterium]|nr:M3 family oligoendopeptidase [Patescibacteria group bacterium]
MSPKALKPTSSSKKTNASAPPAWNLSDLYSSIKDPAIEIQLTKCKTQAERFQKTYKGAIAKLAKTPAALRKAIQAYERLLEEYSKPQIYAALVHAADSLTAENGAFMQHVDIKCVEISRAILFFELELGNLPSKTLETLIKSKELANYSHYLSCIRDYQPHRLDEAREQLLNDLSLSSGEAFVRLYNEELSRQKYPQPGAKSQTPSVSQEDVLHNISSPDRKVRKAAADILTNGLKDQSHRLTLVTNTLLQHKRTLDRYRNYASPEAAQHLSNETDQATVDAMSEAITQQYPLVARYYEFKKKLLKLSELYDYDRYAPLPETHTTFSYDQAKTIVLDSFRRFSPVLADEAQAFFDHNWIDAATRPGKRGGAFCMFNTTDLHPYVLVNFKGSIKDVSTLAHELGHAVHACLARKQSYLNFNMPLTFAETASVFGEMLVFDALRESIKDPQEKLALYLQKIEEMFATVFRQTAMYRFEQDVHALGKEKGELSTEEINQRWLVRQREMFGTSVKMREDYGYWWTYISHFIHTPFYVYSYAFGEILTLSLFARYRKEGAPFVKKYQELLTAGGSKTPAEFLKPFGIDLRDESFWKEGLGYVEELVNEAIELAKQATSSKKAKRA